MSFDERNAAWTGAAREFRQVHSRGSAPRVWAISVGGPNIHTTWGQLGGSMQQATETLNPINVGKKNEKSGAQYALERSRETCRKKHLEGYREFVDDKPLDDLVEKKIDFDDLPASLCFYKPDNSMGAGITKKARAGKVLYGRKRNGLAFILARGTAHPRLYSRRMLRQHDDEQGTSLTWNDRFPHLIEEAAKFMPENSILLGELVMDNHGKDDFKAIQSLTKSLTLQSLEFQNATGRRPSFYIWDVAFWDGQDLVSQSAVASRYELIHEFDAGQYFFPVQTADFFKSPEEAVEYAKKHDWEGWVVVDPEGIYGDKAYNFKGKPDRPGTVCAKLKPEYEDDFVAMWDPENGHGERSTKGRNDHGIKSVALYQYNSKGDFVYISNVSSGLSDAQKKDWANPKKFPMVWKVKYTERFYQSQGDDTNALIFAKFDSPRDDKSPQECINPEL